MFSFAPTDKNKELLEKYTELQDKIKYLIKITNEGEAGEYDKDFKKVKFESDDNLPLNKTLKLQLSGGKYFPQSLLDECLHEL